MWPWPRAHGCICVYLTVSSKWSCCPRAPQGSWGACRCQHAEPPPPAGLPQLSGPRWQMAVQADLLFLGRAPFSSYLSLLALHCSLSPGCGRTRLEQEGKFCLQWACKSCLYCWDGWRHSRGLQERCTGTFPRLRGARAIWPLHLRACITQLGSCSWMVVNSLQVCVVFH